MQKKLLIRFVIISSIMIVIAIWASAMAQEAEYVLDHRTCPNGDDDHY